MNIELWIWVEFVTGDVGMASRVFDSASSDMLWLGKISWDGHFVTLTYYLSRDFSLLGVFQLDSYGELQAFFRNCKILAQLVFQLDHYAPKLYAQNVYNIIIGIVYWKRDLSWLSLYLWKLEQIWPFSNYIQNRIISRSH